ncbi:MAG: hypothetical protein D6714_10175, partial [Bacteroidetes bacterium]
AETFQKIIAAAVEKGALSDLGNGQYKILTVGIPGGFSISQGAGFGQMLVKEDLIFLSNDAEILSQIQSGNLQKSDKTARKLSDLMKNNTIAGLFQMQNLGALSEELSAVRFEEMMFNVNGKGADMKLNLREKQKNSLKAIFEMINEQYKKAQDADAVNF